MGFGNAEYVNKKEKAHRLMERIGRVVHLEGRQFGLAHNGLERQREGIVRRISRVLTWQWI